MREVEVRKNLLVREDGMVKNISGYGRGTIPDWHTGNPNTKGYFQVRTENGMEQVHRLIAEAFIRSPIKGEQINHINHMVGDNRVENLEWVSNRTNTTKKQRNKTHLCGAHLNGTMKNPWSSHCRVDGKLVYIGRYKTEIEAHEAYKEFIKTLSP